MPFSLLIDFGDVGVSFSATVARPSQKEEGPRRSVWGGPGLGFNSVAFVIRNTAGSGSQGPPFGNVSPRESLLLTLPWVTLVSKSQPLCYPPTFRSGWASTAHSQPRGVLHKEGWPPSFRSERTPNCADAKIMRCFLSKTAPQ